MKFVELEADNFKSFEHFRIDLDGHGFVKIDGVNNTDEYSESVGSGKSSIADALSYALTGETVKGNSSMSDVKNMYTKGDCRVSVVFEHGGVSYKIVRGEAGLQLFENGVDISKHLKRETQELIMQKFPFFTPTFIGATVIIGQNMPNAFTNNKPSARKAILEELTNSSFMIEDIKNRLADRKAEWMSVLGDLNTRIVVLETRMDGCCSAQYRAETALNSMQDSASLKNELDGVELVISKLESSVAECKSEVDAAFAKRESVYGKMSSLSADLNSLRKAHQEEFARGLEELHAKKAAADEKLADHRGMYFARSSEANRLKKQIDDMHKNSLTRCPACGQLLPKAHKLDTSKLEAQLEELNAEVSRLGEMADPLMEAVDAVSKEISEYKMKHSTTPEIEAANVALEKVSAELNGCSAELNLEQNKLDSLTNDLNSAIKRKQDIEVKLREVDALRSKYQAEIDSAKEEIKQLTSEKEELSAQYSARQGKLSTLNQVISFATRDFRTILLASIIKRLDAYAKSYCKKMLDTTEISFKDDGNNISISYRGRDFGVLSGGESQVVKMCITLALKKTLEDLVGFTTNIMFFDEILDNCDKSTAQQLIELVSCLELSSTFFISHHDDVYLPVDKTWTVTKTDRISVLTM